MGEKGKQIKRYHDKTRAELMSAIRNFDKTEGLVYKVALNERPLLFIALRNHKLPLLIDYLLKKKRLSENQACTLKSQILSLDRDNWYIAFLTIIQKTNPNFLIKLNK